MHTIMQEVADFHDPCHLIESWSRTVYKTVGLIWRWNRANPQVSAKDTEAIWAQAFMAALLACDGKLSILKVVAHRLCRPHDFTICWFAGCWLQLPTAFEPHSYSECRNGGCMVG